MSVTFHPTEPLLNPGRREVARNPGRPAAGDGYVEGRHGEIVALATMVPGALEAATHPVDQRLEPDVIDLLSADALEDDVLPSVGRIVTGSVKVVQE